PKDEEVFTTPVLIRPDGRFDSHVVIPATDETDTWTVRVHCWSDKAKRDAVGWATIKVARPEVVLTSFTIQPLGQVVRAGDPTTLTCTVVNRSPLLANGVSVRFYQIGRDGRSLIDEPAMTLKDGEARVVRVPWKAEPGCFRFEAQLWGQPEAIGHPSPEERRKTADRAIVSSRASNALEFCPVPIATEIVPLVRAASTSSPKTGESFERRATALIGYVGEQPVSDVSIALNDESSTPTVLRMERVRPGEVYAETFERALEKPALPREYRVVLSYIDRATSREVTVPHTERVQAADFPDLTIVGDAITFLDEANKIAFGDPRPTDGHTVYIDVPVKNLGQSPAGPFGVEAFEGDPAAGGKQLRSLTDFSVRKEIDFLDPGQTRTVRFRWDPFHNAGRRQLYFRVDGDRRITESNESNNVASRSLYVLSKGKLATGKIDPKIPSFDQLQKGIYPLGATVLNEGETTVTKVLVEIYVGVTHTPDNRIGEALVDRLGPTSKIEVMHYWRPTPQQLKRVPTEKFSFIARLKGSSQRVIQLPEL
ncbi:hypothetical protein FJY63_13030, partial [Candidatus Sumerlaeota bacterium]|nr:hypothetical protein [Candidatus Sumerlaeota bacterium]